jgi:phytoene dehydrogenase-like protein
MRNYRAPGTVAKINLTLSSLPQFRGVDDPAKLSGRIHIGPEIDYLERAFDAAKYGEFSREPYLDIAMRAPNVMSIHVQFAPYELREGDWDTRAEEFANVVIDRLSMYAPNLRDLIVEAQVITPRDLEETYGLSGGHIHHGEQTLDQVFTFRPLIGWAQYRTPLKGLYLCGAGTHPGGGITGLPGANAAREITRDFKAGKV